MSLVAFQSAQFLAGRHVPDTGRGIVRSGDGPFTVRRESYSLDQVGVAVEAAQFLAGAGIPEANGTVVAAGQQTGAVRRERNTGNVPRMSVQSVDLPVQAGLDRLDQVTGAAGDLGVIAGRRLAQTGQGRLAESIERLARGLALVETLAAELANEARDIRGRVFTPGR